jgi:hypothetical protein
MQLEFSPSQINALKFAWAAGSTTNCPAHLFTEENKNVLLEHGLIVKDTVRDTYIVTIEGQALCEKQEPVLIKYALMSDKKSGYGGTSKSFDKTFETASKTYVNALLSSFFKSAAFDKIKNLDFFASQLLLKATSLTLSKSMINKCFLHFKGLMDAKLNALSLEKKLNVLLLEKDAALNKYLAAANAFIYKLPDRDYNDIVAKKGLIITKFHKKEGKWLTFQTYKIQDHCPEILGEPQRFKVEGTPLAYKNAIVETCIMNS